MAEIVFEEVSKLDFELINRLKPARSYNPFYVGRRSSDNWFKKFIKNSQD